MVMAWMLFHFFTGALAPPVDPSHNSSFSYYNSTYPEPQLGDRWWQLGTYQPKWNKSMSITGYIVSDGILVSTMLMKDDSAQDCKYVAPTGRGPYYANCCGSHLAASISYTRLNWTETADINTSSYSIQTECGGQVTFLSPVSGNNQVTSQNSLKHEGQTPFTQSLGGWTVESWISNWTFPTLTPTGVLTYFPCQVSQNDCQSMHSRFREKLKERRQGNFKDFANLQEVMHAESPNCNTSITIDPVSFSSVISRNQARLESIISAGGAKKCVIRAESVKVYYAPITRNQYSAFDVCGFSTNRIPFVNQMIHIPTVTQYMPLNITMTVTQWGDWQESKTTCLTCPFLSASRSIRVGSTSYRVKTMFNNRVYLHFDEIFIHQPAVTSQGTMTWVNDYHALATITDVLLQLESSQISSVEGRQSLTTLPLNFADLAWPYDMRIYLKDGCWGNSCSIIKRGDYRPLIDLPPQLLSHPSLLAFSGCTLDNIGVRDPEVALTRVVTTTSSITFPKGAAFSPVLGSQNAMPGSSVEAIPRPTSPPEIQEQSHAKVSGAIIVAPDKSRITVLAKPGPTRAVMVNGLKVPVGEFTLTDGSRGKVDSREFIILKDQTYTLSRLDSVSGDSAILADSNESHGSGGDAPLVIAGPSKGGGKKKSSCQRNYNFRRIACFASLALQILCFVV